MGAADDGHLKVYVDQMKRPIIAIPIDWGALGADDGRAWVGFTARRGRASRTTSC